MSLPARSTPTLRARRRLCRVELRRRLRDAAGVGAVRPCAGELYRRDRDKLGRLQMANRGTAFLDEIGEMSPRMQALLLRFLENGEIQKVGSDSISATADVRIIAATHRDLGQWSVKGNSAKTSLSHQGRPSAHPPLRERREDIPLLVTLRTRAFRDRRSSSATQR